MARGVHRVVIEQAAYRGSVGAPRDLAAASGPEICVVGRSNVGKSSLINLLLDRRGLAHTSRTPGRTRLVNFYQVRARRSDGARAAFTLVDLPGYGYGKMAKEERRRLEQLLSAYLGQALRAAGALLLIDGRHPVPAIDQEVYAGLAEQACPVALAVTKIDAVPKARRALVRQRIERALPGASVVLTSARCHEGREPLWQAMWPWLTRGEA